MSKALKVTSVLLLLGFISNLAMASGRSFRLPVDICKVKPELEKCKSK